MGEARLSFLFGSKPSKPDTTPGSIFVVHRIIITEKKSEIFNRELNDQLLFKIYELSN